MVYAHHQVQLLDHQAMSEIIEDTIHSPIRTSRGVSSTLLSRPTVAFILEEKEKAAFFHPGALKSVTGAECHLIAPAECARALKRLKPQILVTAWGVPPLDISMLSNVQYICHLVGSVRHQIPREYIENGGLVTNWGNLVSGKVAEHALLLILACLRSLPSWPSFFLGHSQSDHMCPLPTQSLVGRRVGIHGFGAVARELVHFLKPFETTISAYTTGMDDSYFRDLNVNKADSLYSLFSSSEVIVECEALNKATRHSVTASHLSALPEDATFVNVGRGAVVDETALLAMASAGRLRIGLDVVAEEPLASDSPWLQLPNVIVSPHIAGPTRDYYYKCGERALHNISNFLSGRELEGRVSLKMYDYST